MLKDNRFVGLILVATLIVTLVPSSIMVYAEKQENKRAEKFIELARRAEERVDELISFVEGIKDEIEIPENITVLLDEAKNKLGIAEAELNVSLAKEAMIIFRKVFGQLHILLAEGAVDTEKGEKAQGLLVAIDRAYERIERINETTQQIIEKTGEPIPEDVETYLDWVKGNLTEAETDLHEAKAALELDPPNVEWAAGNLTEANKNISEAFAALRLVAGWTNHWRVQNFLMGIKKSSERTREKMGKENRRGINVTALLESLGYTDEDGDGSLIDDFFDSVEDLIDNAREKWEDVKEAIEDLKTIREKLREVHRGLAKQRKGVHRGKGRN